MAASVDVALHGRFPALGIGGAVNPAGLIFQRLCLLCLATKRHVLGGHLQTGLPCVKYKRRSVSSLIGRVDGRAGGER